MRKKTSDVYRGQLDLTSEIIDVHGYMQFIRSKCYS